MSAEGAPVDGDRVRSTASELWHGLLEAVTFLTVAPLPRSAADPDRGLMWAPLFFPVVGLAVGLLLAAVLALPLPPLAAAALALAVWVAVTGGLHEDGWADCMDAAFAHVPTERRLEILDDPRVGAHGVTGTVLLLLLRFAALAAIAPAAVVLAPVVGRWSMAVSLAVAPPVRPTGLGARLARHPRPLSSTALTLALVLAVAWWTGRPGLVWVWPASGGAAAAWGWWLVGRFGGLNGDGHGAVGLVAETTALYAVLLTAALP